MQRKNQFSVLLLLTIVIAGTTPLARAELETGLSEWPADQLEEVIVTSQKRIENLQEVPLSISTLTGEDLDRYGVHNTQELQIVIPGLIYNNTGPVPQPYLRGVGTRFAFVGLESSVATYVDDRYLARAHATVFELADVERIEVLKGPQGTLFGRNATGGAIRVVTMDVQDELSGTLTGTVGSYGLRSFSGTVNVPIGETLGTRFTALVTKRDGFADNLEPSGIPELDDRDVTAVRAKFKWNISDRVSSHLTLSYSERDDNAGNDLVDLSPPGLNKGIAAGGISGQDVNHVATAIDAVIHDEQAAIDLRFDINFSTFDLVSITTYSDFEQDANSDADGTSTAALDAVGIPLDAQAFSQEFQLVSGSDGSWQWLTGAYFFSESAGFEIILNMGIDSLLSQGDQHVDTRAFAVFGEATYDFDTRWSLTLGGRWSFEEKEVLLKASDIAPITLSPVPFQSKDNWGQFTPKVILESNVDPGVIYLSYARGFKSGGYNYAASLNDGKPLDPEVLDMIEAGWKTDLLNGHLRFNGSVYYYDYQDLQVTRAEAGSGVTVTENAADANVLGVDLDLAWLPKDWLRLTAGISLLDTEYKEYDASALIFTAVLEDEPTIPGMSKVLFDASGENLLRAPDSSFFVSAEMFGQLGGLSIPIVVTYSYKDDYLFDFVVDPSSERLIQKGYGLLSARATIISEDGHWRFSIWGSNLTNEDDYFMDIVANSTGIRGSHGAPRAWGMDVSYRF